MPLLYMPPSGVTFRMPENTAVTMTTREVSLFLAELGQIRALLGEVGTRLNTLEASVRECQARCSDERRRRMSWIHYAGALVASLLPAALVYYLQVKR